MENKTKKYVWQTKEFRDGKKKAISEGKIKSKCEMCGSKENFVPHHQISFSALKHKAIRKIAITKMSEELGFRFTNSALTASAGFMTIGKGFIRKPVLIEFINNNLWILEQAEKEAKEEYYKFNDIKTLCKECHYAVEHGMTLCSYCKKKYHPKNFGSCLNCKDKAREAYKSFEECMDSLHEEMP